MTAPEPPTSEQIAEAIRAAKTESGRSCDECGCWRHITPDGRDMSAGAAARGCAACAAWVASDEYKDAADAVLALFSQPTPEPECDGRCTTAADLGVSEMGDAMAYPDPACHLHGDPVAYAHELESEVAAIEAQVALVYDHVTGGRISKANTLASEVIAEADEKARRETDEDIAEAIADLAAPTPEHTIEEYAAAYDNAADEEAALRAVLSLAGVKIADEPERPTHIKLTTRFGAHVNGDVVKVERWDDDGDPHIKNGRSDIYTYVLNGHEWEPASPPATPEPPPWAALSSSEQAAQLAIVNDVVDELIAEEQAPAAPESPTVTVELPRDVARRLMLDKRSERVTSDVDAVAAACRAALTADQQGADQ